MNLPREVVAAFTKLGSDQRGEPERAMVHAQFAYGGGVLNPVIEHVGDLTHRMTHHLKHGDLDYGTVRDKVNKTVRWLSSGYGFQREFDQNVRANAEHLDVSEDDLRAKVDWALGEYAKAHRKLVVYNEAQWLARRAAVELGEQDWSAALSCLKRLQRMLSSESEWARYALEYTLDSSGAPVPYRPASAETASKFEDLSPAQQRRYLTEHPNSKFFHGSPHSGLSDDFSNFSGDVAFFTKNRDVARHYAATPTMGAQRGQHDRRSTVYHVDVDPGSTLDLRRPEHREVYDAIRKKHNSEADDPDDHLPRVGSEGFLQRSGLPGFGHVRAILPHAAKHGFSSMLVDEGTQGESLAVHRPQGRVRVTNREEASMPWTAEEFRSKHNEKLTPAQAEKAAKIANAVLAETGDEGKAIRIANSRATASIRQSVLASCLEAELAADTGWNDLSPREQKAYVKAHPGSKYAKNAGGGKWNPVGHSKSLGSIYKISHSTGARWSERD